MNQVSKVVAIFRFLQARTHSDLASLYNAEMEIQVNVAQDGGERIEGSYQGKAWRGWTDHATTWKPFRIPYNANSDPRFDVNETIKFDLDRHAEGVGMTGWNWNRKLSIWVAFDFDAITGHSEKHQRKLTQDELDKLVELVKAVDWVTIRRSTGGKGLHLYVFLEPIPTATHTEHTALARAILAKLSATVGFDFSTKIDVCGGNMWVWHRKMTPDNEGLKLIKAGGKLPANEIPPNWKDHIKVARGIRKRNLPQFIEELDKDDAESLFEELTGQRTRIPLDVEHKKLIEWLTSQNALWWWDADHHMLVTHTAHLKDAHEALQLKGPYKTVAQGTEKGIDHNCFLFPMRHGAWSIRRYTPGTQEAETWDQDGQGWTRCYFNRQPDLPTAAKIHEGIEHQQGGYSFRLAESAIKAVRELGGDVDIPAAVSMRKTRVKPHKQDGKIIVEFEAEGDDDANQLKGWLNEKGKWTKVVKITSPTFAEPEINLNLDDTIRHLVTSSGDDYGWVVRSEGSWRQEPLTHVKDALESLGYAKKEVTKIIGGSIFKAWKLANIPFGPEYPGDRCWNRNSPQLAYNLKPDKENLYFPTWLKMLSHIGKNLDEAILHHTWCQQNGIFTGADYLMCWIASMFQEPLEPLPYLFLYGGQETGKSTLHEALKLLMTSGVMRADAALTSQSAFNGELEHSVLCVIEETDLRKHKGAYNRIKDWVTSRDLLIHRKHTQPFTVNNTTHWIQCANDHLACPVFTGDTRITYIYVDTLKEKIPRKDFETLLRKEANDFLTAIINLELPPAVDRLNVPVIITDEKLLAEEANLSYLEAFLKEKCFHVPGERIEFKEFTDKFYEWLDPIYHQQWSKIRIGREIPPIYAKGRDRSTNVVMVGNIAFESKPPQPFRYVIKEGLMEVVNGQKESIRSETKAEQSNQQENQEIQR